MPRSVAFLNLAFIYCACAGACARRRRGHSDKTESVVRFPQSQSPRVQTSPRFTTAQVVKILP
ncbi:hypothetical protein GALMADRAFT_256258 [Galerina marginata CBS 339.88]|uniref:Secreted protein n=1 Tax=Galerina marginata (strain CBS 339.88) TaxID=685588 RepID=A0A067SDR0_GALM3|nr:hypothetical protein GALMADRAFT_256258 [Galerina marginata CBS 339.88]